MTNILIEDYRGFEIEFNKDSEKFQCVITDNNTKESVSFASVKKFIDDYKKDNQDFKSFWVQRNPNSYGTRDANLKIVGVRKDGRFIAETKDGKKSQISDYNLSDYILVKPENAPLLSDLTDLSENFESYRLKYNENRKELLAKMNIVTLKDYKLQLKQLAI